MLAVLIYITDAIRRTFSKLGRAVSIIVETYQEAQDIRRAMPRRSMED
jgi:hypothetical protein